MGFFCYNCGKKVRGQPVKHGCTRKKYGKNANRRVYDQSGSKSHRLPPSSRGLVCFDMRDKGECLRKNCVYSHKVPKQKQKQKKKVQTFVCFDMRDKGVCLRKQCRYSHDVGLICREIENADDVDDRLQTHRDDLQLILSERLSEAKYWIKYSDLCSCQDCPCLNDDENILHCKKCGVLVCSTTGVFSCLYSCTSSDVDLFCMEIENADDVDDRLHTHRDDLDDKT
mmetsp:Transcript_56124/g.65547  ORF Transcript_56124/g.65547 Transcript_56124/m.65547 type:complete len:226 (+) Transcript_56124:231-908(+)|eukprot:CAMPEP_0194436254 /NCGR_PEP_ID=MMETSP0176-20130528/93475_1 /TAXON_ID=216777 /ORGANISM="Proboscia alata, Strain PI-D3" /LENGTH=225 /DNA_ID=CAMNT_0039256375 /DNA_START=188 /DNA_END=865 /DNA_ORIENTATION=-